MTRLTSVCRIEGSFEMRSVLELLLIDLLVTGLAGVASQVLRGFTLLRNSRLFLLSRSEAWMDQHH